MQLAVADVDSAQLRAQKLSLGEFLQSHLAKHNIAAIFEESRFGELTVAGQLASQHDPPIRWQNISMTTKERVAAGVLDALNNRPYHRISHDGPLPFFFVGERIPADTIQEEFFAKRILEVNDDDRKVVVLVGNMHVLHLAEKLRAMGHIVDIWDDLIPAGRPFIPASCIT